MRTWWLAAAALLLVPPAAEAQRELARADSLLRAGNVERAEAIYFAAARRAPRDPEARFALGRYLASRGAWRVGAVLIEEARRFGGSGQRAASLLAPLYARLDDYEALLALQHVELPAGEAARARWLRTNAPAFAGPDTARIPLLRTGRQDGLGAIRLVIGGDTILAAIDPLASGLVLDDAHLRTPGVRVFGDAGGGIRPAVAFRVLLGPVTVRNAAVGLAPLGGRGNARVGLDWIARWAPTLDLEGGAVILRRRGRVPAALQAAATSRLPLLLTLPAANGDAMPGPWIATPSGVARLGGTTLARLRAGRLTIDPRRGELLLDR